MSLCCTGNLENNICLFFTYKLMCVCVEYICEFVLIILRMEILYYYLIVYAARIVAQSSNYVCAILLVLGL